VRKLGRIAIGAAGVLLAAGTVACGTTVASQSGGGTGTNTGTGTATLASATGCSSASTATEVTVHRLTGLKIRVHGVQTTQHDTALVRALFHDLCQVVGHRYVARYAITCPMDTGAMYSGTFYGGTRSLATFVYRSSGCPSVTVAASGKQQSSLVLGTAAAAAPHLSMDMAAVMGTVR
jgi:hypothetical protein